jgi:hypothetical protein
MTQSLESWSYQRHTGLTAVGEPDAANEVRLPQFRRHLALPALVVLMAARPRIPRLPNLQRRPIDAGQGT